MAYGAQSTGRGDLCSPVRNRYYYGKLLDVFHLDLEQYYFNSKRWLLNRLISGAGVVCGLDVQLTSDNKSVWVTPGVAIDWCGHEIIVCQPSQPKALPQLQVTTPAPSTSSDQSATQSETGSVQTASTPPSPTRSECCDGWTYKNLVICYQECPADPSPALGGDCDTQAVCTPGSIREAYCLKWADGQPCPTPPASKLPAGVISTGGINYGLLATSVTQNSCFDAAGDCCICLASIGIPPAGQGNPPKIDITVRPIVYTNDLLYNLLFAWMNQGQSQTYSKP